MFKAIIFEANNLKVFASKKTTEPKQFGQGHVCLKEENLSFNNNYMSTSKKYN